MNDTGLRHRLMAILAADVAGYSRLMAIDEHGTLDALDAARQVFRQRIDQHFGRIVDTAGDSVLAVFETASGAVDAALAIQRQLAGECMDGREDRRMQFRIGIHLGDVIEKPDGSVYGNGVNVTARLQAISPPGGISVSEAVHSTIGKRSGCSFDDQGQHSVKNIAEPIRAYRLHVKKRVDPLPSPHSASTGELENTARLGLADFILDLGTATLRDLEGSVIEMRPQATAVLMHLAVNPGRIVGKDELLDAVWPGLAVTDNSLAQAIGDARAALGAAGFDVIRTIPRRGYVLFAGGKGTASQGPLAAPARLPAPPAALFGRERDLAAIEALLARHRVVTVIGAGGVGKTVLALAVAHARRTPTRDGVAWVELAPLDDPTLLPSTIAAALGLPFGAGVEPLAGLLAALGPLQCIVVLDNAEHVVDAVARLAAAIVAAAPQVRLLVTSQAPLKIEVERIYRLGGLALPPPGASVAEARKAPAVAMFIDHARATNNRFEVADPSVAIVIRICTRLDALPLAIRLAAARVAMFGLTGLEARLAQRLNILAGGSRDAPERQQTLRAALDWSHGLLPAHEARAFRAMGVFVGGFTLELAVAVCGDATHAEWKMLDTVQSLVERSLVQSDGGDPPRWRLLESAREYALERLDAAGERNGASLAHALALAAAFERAEGEQFSLGDADWLAAWAPDLDNLRAALDWATTNAPQLAVRLVSAGMALFSMLALSQELRRRAQPLEAASESADRRLAARYWFARAHLQMTFGDDVMHDCATRAESIFRELADESWLYQALCLRAMASPDAVDEVDAVIREIDTIERADWPSRWRLPRFLLGFGVATKRGRHAEALDAAQRGLQLARSCGAMAWAGHFIHQIAVALIGLHRYEEALRMCRDGLSDADIESPGAIVVLNGTMANCLLKLNRTGEARQALVRLFELCRAIEWRSFKYFSHVYFGLAVKEERFETAAMLLGYATVAQHWSGRGFDVAAYRDRHRALLATRVNAQRLERSLEQGARLDPQAVCILTLEGHTASATSGHKSRQ